MRGVYFFPYKECKRATITVVIVQFVLQLEDLSFRGARAIVVRRAEGSIASLSVFHNNQDTFSLISGGASAKRHRK